MDTTSVKKQLGVHIEKVIKAGWLNGLGEVKVKVEEDTVLRGATDARLYKTTAQLKFVVKFHLQDVSEEKRGYEILRKGPQNFSAQHLVEPLLAGQVDASVLLTPYLVASTLHEVILHGKASSDWIINDLYEDFLNKLELLWKGTLSKPGPLFGDIYLRRIRSRTKEIEKEWKIEDIDEFFFEVNGKSFGKFKDLILNIEKKLRKIIKQTKYSCITHGDEHAKNILIKTEDIDISKEAWILIDYVKAQEKGDWVFSIAKILHWWQVYYAIENAKIREDLELKNGKLDIDKKNKMIRVYYDEKSLREEIPPICNTLSNNVLNFAKKIGSDSGVFQEDYDNWQERLRIALFAILYGSVPRHFNKKNRFAIPILIGEGLKALNIK